jgi:hypothetical protein
MIAVGVGWGSDFQTPTEKMINSQSLGSNWLGLGFIFSLNRTQIVRLYSRYSRERTTRLYPYTARIGNRTPTPTGRAGNARGCSISCGWGSWLGFDWQPQPRAVIPACGRGARHSTRNLAEGRL